MNPPDRDRSSAARGASSKPAGGGANHSAIAAALGNPSAENSPLAADHASDRYAVVAHELANLLDGSLRWLSLAQNRLGDPCAPSQTAVGEQLGHVNEALSRMSDLVEALMRPGAGHMAALFGSPRTMLEAVEHAVSVVRPLADERKISIALRAEPSLAEVAAGPLFTVISNGLRNAVEASNSGGNIEVHARLYPSTGAFAEIGIDILDEGGNFPSVFGDCVFDFGFTTKEGGTGVGLSVARDIVAELGGSISLTPRAENKPSGAHFRVRVPARPLTNP